MCKRIEQLYASLYVRVGATAPTLEEDDGTQSIGRGDTPHDQCSNPATDAIEPTSAEQTPASTPAVPTEETPITDVIA